eukprot:5383077-Pyramimonas_sp.AAC.1
MESLLAWPAPTQLVIGRMTPKNEGSGDRVIGILNTFARAWSMCREPEVAEWADLNALSWDAAVVGNAALRGGAPGSIG